MRMYVFTPPDNSFRVSYLTNAVSTNDRLFINEIKSEKSGVVTPGLLSEGQAVGLYDDYLEVTEVQLKAKAVALGYSLQVYEDRQTKNRILSMTSPTSVATIINDIAGTVEVQVPYGTTITALVMTFTLGDGATAKIGAAAQTSGSTANNFTSSKVYVITPASGATKSYTVSVTVLPQE